MAIRRALKRTLLRFGYDLRYIGTTQGKQFLPPTTNGSRAELYRPLYSPWLSKEFGKYYSIAAPRTLVSVDRCYVIYILLKQSLSLAGDIIECGVYRGGTAAMIAKVIEESMAPKRLLLFDTFGGMPKTDLSRDYHKEGDFADTSADQVEAFVDAPGIAVLRKGLIPETFRGLESQRIAFAHIDVDIYKSIIDSLEFIWPRLVRGGVIVFDDYGAPTCPGAREAVDDFFAETSTYPLCLPTGQAIVFKHSTE